MTNKTDPVASQKQDGLHLDPLEQLMLRLEDAEQRAREAHRHNRGLMTAIHFHKAFAGLDPLEVMGLPNKDDQSW